MRSYISLHATTYFNLQYSPSIVHYRRHVECDRMMGNVRQDHSHPNVFQIMTRRVRFRLERSPGETGLIDRTGRNLKMEPLTTVSALERYLLKMVGS